MKKKNVFTRIVALIFALVVSIISPLSQIKLPVEAANNSILDVATIPSSNDKMDSKYEFIAKFIRNTTKIETFGSGWKTTADSNSGTQWKSILPTSTGQKGSVGVRYVNVGTFSGKTIDLKITLMNWAAFSHNPGNISYSTVSIGHHQQGYQYVDQKWEFVESGTDKVAKVTGYFTINDIDSWQGVQFSSASSKAIKDIYVSAKTNRVKFQNKSGEYYFYDSVGGNRDSDDLDDMFTFTYKEQSELRFKWVKDYDAQGTTVNREWDTSSPNGEYFGFLAKKPLATSTASPYKTVSDIDEKDVSKNTILNRGEIFTYRITHTVPDEWKEFRYSSYVFSDTVEECLEVKSVKIYNSAQSDVTKNFTVNIDKNKVTASANNLDSTSFYYNQYLYEIEVKIKEDADITSYLEGTHFVFKNKATITIDGDKATSNEVSTLLENNPGSPEIIKMIDVDGKLVESKTSEHGETVKFYGDVTFSQAKRHNSVKIVDVLHPALKFKTWKVYDSSGNDISKQGTIKEDGQKITFTFNSSYLANLIGANIYFYIEAAVDATGDLSDTKGGNIPNVYTLFLDNEEIESNEVYVKVPTKSNQMMKAVLDDNGKETEHLVLEDNAQDINFRGSIQVTNTEKIKSIMLEDNLHKAFKFKEGSLKVTDESGNDLTSKGTITVNGQLIRYTLTGDAAAALIGKKIYWDFKVNYVEGSDLSQLKNNAIPNVMRLFVNGDPLDSNEVTVEPQPLIDDIKKFVQNDKNEKAKSYKLSDNSVDITFIGDIQINNTNKIESVILEDVLHSAFKYKSMKIYDDQGNEVSVQGAPKIDGQIVRFTFNSAYAATLVGRTLRWEITVNYIEGSDLSDLKNNAIPNTMKLFVNGKGTDSDEVLVTPIPIVDQIVKKIQTPEGELVTKYELTNNDEEIVFIGTAKVNNTEKIKEIILEDVLHDAFAYAGMTVYDQDGNNITEKGELITDTQKIQFILGEEHAAKLVGKSLTWRLRVKYIEGSDLSQLHELAIPNTMSIIVNEKPTESEEVEIIPEPLDDEIFKYIIAANDKLEHLKLESNDQLIKFGGDIQINNVEEISEVILEDILHEAFIYEKDSLKVFDSNGKDITEQGEIITDGQKIQFTFKEEHVSALVGKQISWELSVSYVEGSDLSQLENHYIPNIMSLYVNEKPSDSNKITVEPEPLEDSIEKVVVDEEGKEKNNIILSDNAQDIKFKGYIQINNSQEIKGVILEDILHKAFKYKEGSLKVFDNEGKDITNQGEVKVDGQNIQFVFKEEHVSALVGKQISWELSVNYVEGSDLSELTNLAVPNVMTIIINEQPTDSNEVTVEPIPLENSIIKMILNRSGDYVNSHVLEANDEIIHFRGTMIIANDKELSTVVLRDKIESGLIVNLDSVIVTADDEVITSLGKVNLSKDNELTFTVKENAQSLAGKAVAWDFDVSYDQGLDFSQDQTRHNTMSLELNGDVVDSNEVEVKPTIVKDNDKDIVKSYLPQTGQRFGILFWSVLGVLLIASAVAIQIREKKKNKQ